MDDVNQMLQKINSMQNDQHHVSVDNVDTTVKNNIYEDSNCSVNSLTQQQAQAEHVRQGRGCM